MNIETNRTRTTVETGATALEVQCCVCGRVRQGGHWVSPEDPNGANRSHSYCPVCYRRAMAAIDAYFDATAKDEAENRPTIPFPERRWCRQLAS